MTSARLVATLAVRAFKKVEAAHPLQMAAS